MWGTAVFPTMVFMMTPASVMIIESQPLMRTALSTALAAEGITVLAELARSEEVTPHLLNQRPDMILFSLYTTEQAELAVISSLRQAFPETAVAVLVTGEQKGQGQAALAHGAQLIVDKTASRDSLLAALNSFHNLYC